MLTHALVLAAGLAQSPAAAPETPLGLFIADAETWLLQAKPLPSDTRLRLLRMRPEDRLQAIIFLRRAGLMTGAVWPVEDLLRPAISREEAGE
ncbi:MAG: hypothetical protein Q4G22_09295 [Paracoccus sp. (in: a-proteobacteria)]|uniref:hypothetical protein n=1 Tax=Paracoccus sp. TaxID=267 RepID=UPI0026DF10FB|nr:hypothetical protein [Paracoccus sp. (in: a-proteobacteria)]MDO5632021.1 hypothetical protein [Paracoccus sp. (in: a-proteobacteria)]